MSNPSIISILQTPQVYGLQQMLSQKPIYLYKLIDYISCPPDILLQNQRQCYVYPLKSVQILNSINIYKLLIKKQVHENKIIDVTKQNKQHNQQKEWTYPYLERLFKNLKMCENEEVLLGYIDRVMYSITKKTPEIYEFFKDNQQYLIYILKTDKILFAFKDFLTLFLTQSTMGLYIFLKNLILRSLMFRIVQDESTGPIVYQLICEFYSQLLKQHSLQHNEQDRQQLEQVLKNIEQQNFMALLALKISSQHTRRTYFIAKLLVMIISSPNQMYNLVIPYVDTYTEYLETYEESDGFMLVIMQDQLMMLKLIIKICSVEKDGLVDVKEQLLKRLLVYCNVHEKNSILHSMLYTIIQILFTQSNHKIILKAKVIQFIKNNLIQSTTFNYRSLVTRICKFYYINKIHQQLQNQQQEKFVQQMINIKKEKIKNCVYFKINQEAKQNGQANYTQSDKVIEYDSQKEMKKIKLNLIVENQNDKDKQDKQDIEGQNN